MRSVLARTLKMPFSTRDPAELQVGKTYRFTQDINNHSYLMKLCGTLTKHIWWQDCQYTGIRPGHPTSTVYDFESQMEGGWWAKEWRWELEYDENAFKIVPCKSRGVWTEVE